jgi:hypothetical protein
MSFAPRITSRSRPLGPARLWRAAAATAIAVAAVVAVTASAGAAPNKGDAADEVVPFARDVFVIVGSSLRNPDDTTAPDAPLFNVAGVNLELTWGQWTGAAATSLMRVAGGHTNDELTFSGLVPGGVYSVFYGTLTPDSENPLCPGVERALPLTSTSKRQQPDAASFVAAPDGTATFSARVSGNPLEAVQVFIELVYHFDGNTYGSLPNKGEFLTQDQPTCRSSFGEDAMRQMIVWQKI